jgi:RNA polymerase sigma factor (TIGR02999 family)
MAAGLAGGMVAHRFARNGSAAGFPAPVTTGHPTGITDLLIQLSQGRREALDQLVPIVYNELRAVAHRHLGAERAGHTLNTTALVHETYLKLVNVRQVQWRDRAHFFAMAGRLMRRILIDYARARKRDKRGGELVAVSLDEAMTCWRVWSRRASAKRASSNAAASQACPWRRRPRRSAHPQPRSNAIGRSRVRG